MTFVNILTPLQKNIWTLGCSANSLLNFDACLHELMLPFLFKCKRFRVQCP